MSADMNSPVGKAVKMAPKIAFRNLFHDKVSLLVTLVGIVFAVVLVSVQSGLFQGARSKIAVVINKVENADLWIVPIGTKSFDDPSLLTGREKHAALSTPGVADVKELIVSFAQWRKPQGGKKSVVLVGSDWSNGGLKPWNLAAGSLELLGSPNAVAVDSYYFNDLGLAPKGTPPENVLGMRSELNERQIQIAAITERVRSFTTMPYVFTSLSRARELSRASTEQATYQLVTLAPGADLETVRSALQTRLPDTEVLTQPEFRRKSVLYWLFNTGAGGALIGGLALGVIVGVVIVAQTLYANTKDHINEFATLRALGASARYIHSVILLQAMMSAIIGFVIGHAMAIGIAYLTRKTSLTILIEPHLTLILLLVTLLMCAFSAVAAILKVTRIDPAGVFSR